MFELSYRASVSGELPSNGTPSVHGVVLPVGFQVSVMSTSEPKLWATREPLEDPVELYLRLLRAFSFSGLWPLFVEGADGLDWLRASLEPAEVTDPASVDVTGLLARSYEREIMRSTDRGPLPASLERLADPVTGPDRLDWIEDWVDTQGWGMHLALIPTARPADALLTLGWRGAMDGWFDYDAGTLTAILRSLEDRFGTVPVTLDEDKLALVGRRLPTSPEQALLVAAETVAITGGMAFERAEDFVLTLPKALSPIWDFSW